jgi:hypothetical protein
MWIWKCRSPAVYRDSHFHRLRTVEVSVFLPRNKWGYLCLVRLEKATAERRLVLTQGPRRRNATVSARRAPFGSEPGRTGKRAN